MKKKAQMSFPGMGPSANARIMRALGQAARIAMAGAGVAAAGAFLDKMMDYFRNKNIKAKSSEYFQKMLEEHPALEKEDPAQVAKYWASLYHFAPYMAQDPLAAGAYIRQSLARGYADEFGGPPPDTFNTLSDINKKLVDVASHGRSTAGDALRRVMGPVIAGA